MKKIFFVLFLLTSFSFTVFSQGISLEQQRKLREVLLAVSTLYVDSIDDRQVVQNTIVSMLRELDPHSSYVPVEEVERVREPLQGSFYGIGVQFQMLEDTLFVVQTVSGTPAEKVGVQPGDRIIYVEDTLIAGVRMRNTDIMEKLRGPRGTEVNVKILRRGENELLSFKMIRDRIPVYTVDASYMIGDDIGVIRINNFGRTTLDEYRRAFDSLREQGMKHLILNLQGNGGGFLNAAIELSDQFLSNGQLIVYTEGLNQRRRDAIASRRGNFQEGKLIILVDESSASASEIVAGAVQDWDRGIVVGRRTFGKGLVQGEFPLSDGSLLRLTTARYHTPTGRSIQRPFGDGVEKYARELMNRLERGELMYADSIQFPDSLRFKTLRLGRTVYGGGGIMPDVFIPIDTARFTDYHRRLIARGVMNRTTIQYLERNREELRNAFPTFELFKENYQVGEDFITQLIENGETEDIPYNEEQMAISRNLIKLQHKARVANNLWNTNEFFRIIDQENEAIQRAVQILRTPGEFERILSRPKRE